MEVKTAVRALDLSIAARQQPSATGYVSPQSASRSSQTQYSSDSDQDCKDYVMESSLKHDQVEDEAAQALLQLTPYQPSTPEADASGPGSPPPLMTSSSDSPAGGKMAAKTVLSATSQAPVKGQYYAQQARAPDGSLVLMPFAAATAPIQHQRMVATAYPSTLQVQQPTSSGFINTPCHVMYVSHQPNFAGPTMLTTTPYYHPMPMATAVGRSLVKPPAVSGGKRSVKTSRTARKRRCSSSETSDYHSLSQTSERYSQGPLLSPPITESGASSVSSKRALSSRPSSGSPVSPLSSCSNVEEDPDEEEIDVSGDAPVPSLIGRENIVDSVKKYICANCCDAFDTMADLEHHHSRLHTEKRPYKCDVCDKAFQHQYSLRVHRRTQHNDVDACVMHTCEHCDHEFASAASLRVHARMHTGERPFKCLECGKTFMRSHQLKMHHRVHTNTKPHQCQVCGKSFTQFKYLKEHCQRHARFLPYKCDTCGKAFLRPSHLKKHTKVHSVEERVFQSAPTVN